MDVPPSGPEQVMNVPSWGPQQVVDWLTRQNFVLYASNFLEKQVDGKQLLELDSTKMKVGALSYMQFFSNSLVAKLRVNVESHK